MFKTLKDSVQANFKELAKQNTLFYKEIDRDLIFQKYLDGFAEEFRQEHNCNCCKSFLRQYGGIVAIINGKTVSIWDNIPKIEKFDGAVKNLQEYIASLPITDVFLTDLKKCGTNKTPGGEKYPGVIWEHFYIEVNDLQHVEKKDNIPSKLGEKRTKKETLQRALNELTLDAVDTILELISQNSLYRGKEFEGIIKEFKNLKKECNNTQEWYWLKSTQISPALAGIRNTAIGTLLIDLSEGVDLDTAVTKFERVMAPANYKRPTALVTPKMVQQAKEKLTEMGLLESMERRYANVADLDVNNLIFTDKSSELSDVFDEISKDAPVNPKTLTKVEEISIEDFIEKVVPTSKSIEVLLENNHLNNMVSLITAQDKNAPSLFKWNNPFSWSYTGGITDSMKERVKAAGGKVDGVLRCSMIWNDENQNDHSDLDLWCQQPDNQQIGFSTGFRKDSGNQFSSCGGQLDLDDRGHDNKEHIENIYFLDLKRMKDGIYRFWINQYSTRNSKGFKAEIEFNGEIYSYQSDIPLRTGQNVQLAEVTLKKGVFSIEHKLNSNSRINSKEKWGVKTHTFTKVRNLMFSPNYWEKKQGNKHYFFVLDKCISDESPRPFFNEFLKEEFNENRKVFEILGSKVKVPDTKTQLSGIGFSDTQRNSIIVRVQGKFKRNLKVNF